MIHQMHGMTLFEGPATIPTLPQYLDAHAEAVQGIVANLDATGDIAPMFYFVDKSGGQHVLLPTYQNKDADVMAFKAIMAQKDAVMYALVTSAWMLVFDAKDPAKTQAQMDTFEREGTGGAFRDQRIEIAQITVGDHTQSLTRTWRMRRSDSGVTLIQETDLDGMLSQGRMVDLLAKPKH